MNHLYSARSSSLYDASMFERRIADKLTWKQFQSWNGARVYTGKSKQVIHWIAIAKEHRATARFIQAKIDMYHSLEVIEGGLAPYFPSRPCGQLVAV